MSYSYNNIIAKRQPSAEHRYRIENCLYHHHGLPDLPFNPTIYDSETHGRSVESSTMLPTSTHESLTQSHSASDVLPSALTDLPCSSVITRPAPGLDVTVVHGFLSPAESQALLDCCDEIGFSFWGSSQEPSEHPAISPDESAASKLKDAAPSNESDEDEAMLPGELHYMNKIRMNADGEAYDTAYANVKQRESLGNTAASMQVDGNANVAGLPRAFRSADTIEADLPRLTALLTARARRLFPPVLHVYDPDDAEELTDDVSARTKDFKEAAVANVGEEARLAGDRDTVGCWVLDSLSENILLAHYGEGGHFAPHVDGSTIDTFNRRSFYTLMIYLNTCDRGGETHILTGDQRDVLVTDPDSGKIYGNGQNRVYSMAPTQGAAITFGANVLHEGSAVRIERDISNDELNSSKTSSSTVSRRDVERKVILRGDMMYRRVPALLDSTSDVEAFKMYQAARVAEADGNSEQAVSLFRRIRKLSAGIADIYQL